jgi:adenosylhomocysteine nucleosidase
MLKIAIIGAMEEEVTILRDTIQNRKVDVIANSEFTTGTLHGKDVVLLKSGIGKVNAAMSTTILMERYQPDYIINTGSAGGFNPDLNVGDLIISTEVCHHDVDATAFGYEYGQVPQMPLAYPADEKLIAVAEKAAEELEGMKIVKGLIGSGDSFMSDPVRVNDVKEKFPEMQAAEMEGSAIAQVCYQYGIPFVVIRSLSDIAGKNSGITFDQFIETASKNSAQHVLNILKNL